MIVVYWDEDLEHTNVTINHRKKIKDDWEEGKLRYLKKVSKPNGEKKGDKVVQWLEVPLHSRKVCRFNSLPGIFYVWSLHVLPASALVLSRFSSFLLLSKTCMAGELETLRCLSWECDWLFISMWPWNDLATSPGCHSAFALWQLGESPADPSNPDMRVKQV